MQRPKNKLELYRAAVQHPEAEVAFLLKAYAHYREQRRAAPTRLREDFAGTVAVAAAWVALHEDHRALAVEAHAPTLRWAKGSAAAELGGRAADLHMVLGDVLRVQPPDVPKVDITVALNFSTFIYHTPQELLGYFLGARRGLRPGGLLVVDAYGGPGAMRLGVQRRDIPASGCRGRGEYIWEQRSYDAVTARIDCRIHFRMARTGCIRDAFIYDWRLWSLPEILELMRKAGFARAEVWCDRYDPRKRRSDGIYRPRKHMPAREDWVAYVVGVK